MSIFYNPFRYNLMSIFYNSSLLLDKIQKVARLLNVDSNTISYNTTDDIYTDINENFYILLNKDYVMSVVDPLNLMTDDMINKHSVMEAFQEQFSDVVISEDKKEFLFKG